MTATFERNPFGDLFPRRATIKGLVNAAAWSIRGCIDEPRWTTYVPKRRIDDFRINGIEGEIDRTNVVVFEENLLPRSATVARTIDAAIGIRCVDVAECRTE